MTVIIKVMCKLKAIQHPQYDQVMALGLPHCRNHIYIIYIYIVILLGLYVLESVSLFFMGTFEQSQGVVKTFQEEGHSDEIWVTGVSPISQKQ